MTTLRNRWTHCDVTQAFIVMLRMCWARHYQHHLVLPPTALEELDDCFEEDFVARV